MFKNSDNVFFYRDQNEGREMFAGFKKAFEGNTGQGSKHRLFMSPQSRMSERHPSPFLGKLINKQNLESTGNHLKNPHGMSPMKLPLTPSKLKNVYQSPRGVLKDVNDGIQFRTKSPNSKLFDFKKPQVSQYETTREEDQGYKLLNLTNKRGSMQNNPNLAFQSKGEDDKKHKNDVLDDIIKNCGKKQQQNQIIQSTGMQFRPKTPFSKLHGRVKTLSNFAVNEQIPQQYHIECYNNDGKQAKYTLLSDGNPSYFCSKCAIILIQQGYNVQQLESSGQPQQPKPINNETLQILQCLASASNKLEGKHQNLRQLKNKHSQSYNSQLNAIDQYYNSLIKLIEELRNRDKQIILEYQTHSLREVNGLIDRIQSTINDTYAVKVEIQNKPEMVHLMRTGFEQHILLCQELIQEDASVSEKSVSVMLDRSRIQEFKSVLMHQFSLMIQSQAQQGDNQKQNMDGSKGVAFSFEGNMLLEQQSNQQKPFRDLFCGEDEENCEAVYQAEQEVIGSGMVEGVYQDGSCSPSFKRI